MKKTLLCLALVGLLTACGSDSDSSSHTPSPPSTITKTGVLINGPVSGVDYYINGVKAGTTNTAGEFEYIEGDEITFRIGNFELGTVQAAERITPVELAENNEAVATNLLILLQSLDADGEYANGIEIPTAVSKMSANALNLSQDSSTFMTQFEPILQSISGPEAVVVDIETAKENFTQTFLKDIAGVWYAKNDESQIVLQITQDGQYMLGEPVLSSSEGNMPSGMEKGTLTVDALAGNLWAIAPLDTNQDWGLSNSGQMRDMKISFDGTQLKISETLAPEENATFTKIPHVNSGIVGAWNMDQSGFGKQLFVFNADGSYLLVDPLGAEADLCGGPGVEYGRYRYQNNQLSVTEVMIDTNGCAGFHDDSTGTLVTAAMTITNSSATLTVSDDSFILYRVNE